MQNPEFLRRSIEDLENKFGPVEVIPGDRYCPVHALRLRQIEMPASVDERTVDITIPITRCLGYLPGTTLAGLHVDIPLHSTFAGEKTLIPFCDPVEDTDWLVKTERFYPFYGKDPEKLIGTSYICLNNPAEQPESPLKLLEVAMDYLKNWSEHAFKLAMHHGAVMRGDALGDPDISADWIEHLVERASPTLKAKLLSAAHAHSA